MTRDPVLRPRPQLGPGSRLVVEFQDDGGLELIDEEVLPERVHRLDANQVKRIGEFCLSRDDVDWLHDLLGKWIATRGP